MRVLLIPAPLMDWTGDELGPIAMDRARTSPPLGIYWLAAILRQAGHAVDILDLIAHGCLDGRRIAERAGQADLVGISANSLSWPAARRVVAAVKQAHPDMPVVLGGLHGTHYPEHVFAVSDVDFIVRGEGERPLLSLIDALSGRGALDQVPSLCRRSDEGIVIKPVAAMLTVEDLEGLPDPAYDLLPTGVYETLSVESARGCRFSCTFCSTKFRGSWRGICAETFVGRLQRLHGYLGRTKHQVFSFVDDLYTYDVERVPEITRVLAAHGLEIKATIDARATDVVRGRVAEALAPITNHMLIGAECGYDEGLRTIRKGCTTGILEAAAAKLNDVGIAGETVFSFIIGFPFETREDCMRTIEFASSLMTRYGVRIYLQWFNTIPGSKIWDGLAGNGDLDISMYDDFGFFTNRHLWKAGVRLSDAELQDLCQIVYNINTVLLFTNRRQDVMQFSPPEWLWMSDATVQFPSHGYLTQ